MIFSPGPSVLCTQTRSLHSDADDTVSPQWLCRHRSGFSFMSPVSATKSTPVPQTAWGVLTPSLSTLGYPFETLDLSKSSVNVQWGVLRGRLQNQDFTEKEDGVSRRSSSERAHQGNHQSIPLHHHISEEERTWRNESFQTLQKKHNPKRYDRKKIAFRILEETRWHFRWDDNQEKHGGISGTKSKPVRFGTNHKVYRRRRFHKTMNKSKR